MKNILLIIAGAVALTAAGEGLRVEPLCEAARGWRLAEAVSDEFSGNSLDFGKWDDWCRTFGGRSAGGTRESEPKNGFLFSPDNVRVDNGELVLTARLLNKAENTRQNGYLRYAPYAVAIVKSRERMSFGYYEMRAKTMKACVSNAFWLYDPHSADLKRKFTEGDYSEEIDIFEVTGRPDFIGKCGDQSKNYFNTLHLYCTPYLEGVVNRKKITPPDFGSCRPLAARCCDAYHVYGLLWTPEKIVWYLDGQAMFERKNEHFRRPLHVTIDCEVFCDWFGTPDPADLPAEFRVDYVRVWAMPM